MVIKASAAAEIRALVRALGVGDEVSREAAIARLAVIGERAVPQLLAGYHAAASRSTRTAILRALEPIADARVMTIARQSLAEGGEAALAALAVLRGLLPSDRSSTDAEVLDVLLTVALDQRGERRVRLAAARALESLEALAPEVRARLGDAAGHAGTGQTGESDGGSPELDAVWNDALEGHLPDSPAPLRHALAARGSRAPLGELRRLVDRVRARETAARSDSDEWRSLRGALHQTLALRKSRVALYDLRESLERAESQLPPSFLAAVQVVGDRSCLEALAAAYSRAADGDERWRHQLGSAFRAIAAREKVTTRHAIMKRVAARWPDAVSHLRG